MSEEKNWIPEKYRNDPTFGKFTGVEAVFESYKNLEGFVGNSIRKPDPSDADAVAKALEQIGAPKSTDAYKVGNPDDPGLKLLQQAALKAKMLPNQWEALAGTYDSIASEAKKAAEKRKSDLELELRQQLGTAYDGKMEVVKRTVAELKDTPKAKAFEELQKINPKLAVEMMLMDAKTEDNSVKGNPTPGRTRDDVEKEIKALQKDAYEKLDPKAYAKIQDLQKELDKATA